MVANNSKKFQQTVWEYYQERGRDLPWRKPESDGGFDAYKILVSEIMLQQTQAPRVIPKYHSFLKQFPSLPALADASLGDVLRAWSGLGYNRRAKYLHEAAVRLKDKSQTWTREELETCNGIGKNTAAAICVYSYNQPLVFIETNIRTVFIHHFFSDRTDVTDKELLPLIEQALEAEQARNWYWALMDYGAHLKRTLGNFGRYSRHYVKQTRFEGSLRQVRGQVLKELAVAPKTEAELAEAVPDERLKTVLAALASEQLIHKRGRYLTL